MVNEMMIHILSGVANKEDYYLTSQLVLVCDSLGAAVLSDPFFYNIV